jgi:hypothetical protein
MNIQVAFEINRPRYVENYGPRATRDNGGAQAAWTIVREIRHPDDATTTTSSRKSPVTFCTRESAYF